MRFSGKIKDGTSNKPLNFGRSPWPWWRFVSPSASSLLCASLLPIYIYYDKVTSQ